MTQSRVDRRHTSRGFRLVLSTVVSGTMLAAGLIGAPPAQAAAPEISSVVAGWQHSCALTSGGAVWCWGLNDVGQLGDGTTTDRSTPVVAVGLSSGVTKIAANGKRTCAIVSDQTAKCWGGNSTGAVGDGTTLDRSVPTKVSGLSGVADIAVGAFHTCAVVTAGAGVSCWGLNDVGQLGNGTTTSSTTPTPATIAGAVSVSTGGKQSCAVTSIGGAKCWGDNASGQLGDGTAVSRSSPVDVSGLTSGVASLAAGGQHTCALLSSGGVKCFGRNNLGQIGDGSGVNQWAPVDVSGLTSGVSLVVSGRWHSCAVTTAEALECWGSPHWTFDNPSGPTYPTPVSIGGLSSEVVSAATGEGHTCAVVTAGRVECFGVNSNGQLGNASTTNSATPVLVRFPGLVLATADFDGDGRTDVAVFRSTSAAWYVKDGATTAWGTSGDIAVPGDYDGDGRADVAVFRPSDGVWYVEGSAGTDITSGWGTNGDIPVPGDYDGNGTTDIAVFRPSSGSWYVQGGASTVWGANGDIPVPGDYDGNGTTDVAVFRAFTGAWYVQGGASTNWGTEGDHPLPLPAAVQQEFS